MKKHENNYKEHLNEKIILKFLKDIENGDVILETKSRIFYDSGSLVYYASNGWQIQIFWDCGNWDYIQSIQKGGKVLDFWQIQKYYKQVYNYKPSEKVAKERYKYESEDFEQVTFSIA